MNLARAVAGWRGIHDAAGKPLECVPENVAAAAVAAPWFSRAAILGYPERFSGPKTSKPPPAA